MTVLAVTLALLIDAGWTEPRPAGFLAQRFREVCVATDMRREAFEAALSGRGFEPLLTVIRPGEEWKLKEWTSGYDDRGVQMVMSGVTAIDRSRATDCATFDPNPQGDWRGDVETLAQELGMTSAPHRSDPDVSEARSWTAGGDQPLTLHYEIFSSGGVVVRLDQAMVGHVE